MKHQKFIPGQSVEGRIESRLGWRLAIYVGIYVGENTAYRLRHVVECPLTGKRLVPDGRIRPCSKFKFKLGARCVCHTSGSPIHGTIIRVFRITALVLFDGGPAELIVDLDFLQPETAEDISKQAHRAAIKAAEDKWSHAIPQRIAHSRC